MNARQLWICGMGLGALGTALWASTLGVRQIWFLSLGFATLGIALWGSDTIWRLRGAARAKKRMAKTLAQQQAIDPQLRDALAHQPMPAEALWGGTPQAGEAGADGPLDLAASLQPPAWLQSGLAKALFADEDRQLLDQAGIALRRGSAVYVLSRLALAMALPLLALALLRPGGTQALLYGFLGFGLGLMLPKWIVRSRAGRRRAQVVQELPLFVDLVRLLQGVGLSVDQSLQILAREFSSVLPVLGDELDIANQLYHNGRSREQAFQRLVALSADEDMKAIVSLLAQVDRHGGAVQEPLREFGLRLREKRQAGFKEKIGAITVKMTGVMVLTLLPALMVITAGPGFMAVIRSLSGMGGR